MTPPVRPEPPVRLEPIERLLSKWKVASRTEAQRLVLAGRVRAAGVVLNDPREVVDPRRGPIEIDGLAVGPAAPGRVWLALNKPRGVVSTTSDPEGRRTVMDLVGDFAAPGLAPVGRLDQASAGLLLLSNDSVLADRILDPATHVAKRYRVKVEGPSVRREVAPADRGLARGRGRRTRPDVGSNSNPRARSRPG